MTIPGTRACGLRWIALARDGRLHVLCPCGWSLPVPSRSKGHSEHSRHVYRVRHSPRGEPL